MWTRSWTPAALGALLVGASLGCDQPPAAEGLPEWKPTDHHSMDDPGGGPPQGQQAPAPKGAEIAQLVDVAWRQQCVQCHGASGRGDGPQGPMLHASDLTDAAWQAKVSDADIAAIIKNGKDKMPKNNLPDAVIQGLVARIRQLKGG